jgi:membrane protease YdiL (CAAX protease family)
MTLTPEVALLLALGALAVANALNNQWAPRAYLATCAVTTALLIGLYARTGRPWDDAGLGRDALWPGLGWGLLLTAVVATGYAIAARLPATRGLFHDQRAKASPRDLAYQVGLRIPFGTVLLEEVAFRGVLLGLLTGSMSAGWAVALSAALFGLWHILPSRDILRFNPTAGRTLGGRRTRVIAGAVLTTAVAGVLLGLIVRSTGSLLPALALHWATNGLGYVAAFLVARRKKDDPGFQPRPT